MSDLRTLAQAFADAVPLTAAYYRHRAALADALDGAVPTQHVARAILAVYAQGYARAMGDVVERADHSADYTGWSDYALGHRDAHERLAVWARERLPAAAERD